MKNRILWIVFVLLVFGGIVFIAVNISNKMEITDFQSCAAAGNPVMESYPRQCIADGITYFEIVSDIIFCQPEQREAEICLAVYQPVCAKVNIQCITTPCNPVYETFSNSCEACKNELVEFYTIGECDKI
jgi:hypothetical protein